MAKQSDVYVKLKLDSKDFNKNLDKSSDAVKDFEKDMGGAKKMLAGTTGVMAAFGVAAVGATAALIANAVKMGKLIQTTDRYARSTGIATTDLLAMNLAFRELGIDSDEANEGLKTFAENIGDAIVNGSGPAKESLDRLGITLEDLQGKSTDEQFLIFADAMSLVETASERTFLAIQAGGEDFDKMNVLFDLSTGKLRELTEAQKQYSESLDMEALRQTATDTNKLAVAGDKLALTFAGAVAPGLTQAANAASNYLAGLAPLMDFYVEWEMRGFRGGLFDDTKDTTGTSRADELDKRLNKMKGIVVAEAKFKEQLQAEQALLLAKNKAEIKTTEQLEKQFAIFRGMEAQEGKERAVSMEVFEQREQVLKLEAQVSGGGTVSMEMLEILEQREQVLKLENQVSGGGSDLPSPGRLQTSGLLERGSAEEVNVREGRENEHQQQMIEEAKEQTRLLKKLAGGQSKVRVVNL